MSEPNAVEKIQEVRRNALLKDAGFEPEGPFQLPLWGESHRSLPNDYARSALFGIKNKNKRRVAMENEPIFHLHDQTTMMFTGVELRAADDELVWLQVLNYAKHEDLGAPFTFTLYRLCKDLGWGTNDGCYERADNCLRRLRAGVLWFSGPRLGTVYDVPLIAEYKREKIMKNRGRCLVRIDPKTIFFFVGNHFSMVPWVQYRALSPIARRLFDYFASHKDPFPLSLDKFKSLCNSDCSTLKKWRQMVREACKELTGPGLVKSAHIEADRIFCTR